MIKKLLHTRYRVRDLDKTIDFYQNVLGLELVRRHTSGRGSQLVFFKAPGKRRGDRNLQVRRVRPGCRSAPT